MRLQSMRMDVSELLLVLLCLVSIIVVTSGNPKDTTYRHTLPNGSTISCNLCPPGTYLTAYCTSLSHDSTCAVCPPDYFQSTYNQADACAPCSSCTMRRDRVYKTCNTTSDTECRCQDGYYLKSEGSSEGVCLPHTKCSKGKGVIISGNHERDTECDSCAEGYFSPNVSSTQICQPCSSCPPGFQIWEICSAEYDTKCEPRLEGSTEYKKISDVEMVGIICGVVFTVIFIILVICIFCVARRGHGPEFLQNIYKKSRQICSRHEPTASNGYVTTPQRDDTENKAGEQTLLLNTFTDLSKDLIDKEWKFFFMNLFENSHSYINEVEINKPNNVRDQIHTLLKDWVAREKEKATSERLIEALSKHERNDLVERYFTSSKKQSNGSAVVTEV